MASKDKVPGWDRVGHKKPTLRQLQAYVIPKIAKNWSGIGIELYDDDDASHLEIIRSECPGDIMKACTEMFKYWRKTYVNASWTKLINALRSPGLRLNSDALDIMKVVVKELEKDDSDDGSGPPDAPVVNSRSAAVVNILDEKPDILNLKQIVIPEVKAHWDDLAYSMKYEILQVEAIDRNGRDVGDRCSRLFQDWLETPNGCTPKTWKKLIERIRSVSQLYAAAERIKKKLISESKLSTKEKIPVVTNTGLSDNEVAPFEDKSARAAHKTKVVNKSDDHSDDEGAPYKDRPANAASKRKPSRQSPSRCLEDPCLCGMKYCAIFMGIVAVITVGILNSNNATINDIIASITSKYGNEARAEESNNDDSSSQGAPSEDILSKSSNTTISDIIASSPSKYGNEEIPSWFYQTQLCYQWRPDGNGGQCGAGESRLLCAFVGLKTPYYRDDTDNRGGGCRMQWAINSPNAELWFKSVQICYRWYADGNGGQCGGGAPNSQCASIGKFTKEYRDDTDNRSGGCRMSWQLSVPDHSPHWLRTMSLCFDWYADGDGGQCGGGVGQTLCATANSWTTYYRDDTDSRGGGCRMSWSLLLQSHVQAVAEESNDDVSGSQGAPAVDILNKKPEMADLNKIVVKKVMIQWEQLAEGFRYDGAIIAKIKLQNRENPEECCREFLRDWLVTDNGIKAGPKTWSTLFDIIKEYTSIGRDIREEMITQVKELEG